MIAIESDNVEDSYLKLLSRGGLITPSFNLIKYVCHCFAIFDLTGDMIIKYVPDNVRVAGEHLLDVYNNHEIHFSCDLHTQWIRKYVNNVITNIFFNNEQKLTNSDKRKDEVKDFKKRQLKKR